MARNPRVESPKDSPAPHGPTPTDFTTFFNLGTEATHSPDPTSPLQLMDADGRRGKGNSMKF